MTSWIHSVIIESWTQTANTARHSERRNGVKISAAGQEACTPDRAAWPLPGLTARKPVTQCHTRAHGVSSHLTTKSRHSCRSRSEAKHRESVKLTSWSNPPGRDLEVTPLQGRGSGLKGGVARRPSSQNVFWCRTEKRWWLNCGGLWFGHIKLSELICALMEGLCFFAVEKVRMLINFCPLLHLLLLENRR